MEFLGEGRPFGVGCEMREHLDLGRGWKCGKSGHRQGAWRAGAPRPARSSAGAPAAPPCGPLEFRCGSGECAPRGWRCDGEEDCADGSDERGCGRPCARHHAPCARGPHCVSPAQLCDGVPHCPDGSDEDRDACGESPGWRAAGGARLPPPPPAAPLRPRGQPLRSAASEPLIFFMKFSLKTVALPPRPSGEKGLLSLPTFRQEGMRMGPASAAGKGACLEGDPSSPTPATQAFPLCP